MAIRPGAQAATGAWIGWLLWWLDRLRATLLRQLVQLFGAQRMRSLLSQRELRVAVGGSIGVAVALLLTVLAPLPLLALSPLLLGVPHLLADVRYLVAQPGYHRRLRLAIPVGLALLLAGLGLGMPAGLAAVGLTLLLARSASGGARRWRRLAGLGLVGGLLGLGWRSDFYWLELGLAHLHNFVAVLLFYLWRWRPGRLHFWPLGLFALAAVALLGGGIGAAPTALDQLAGWTGLDAAAQRDLLAPLLTEPLATRLLLLFAFAQAVHYTIWLRLIPDEARPRPAPRPFRASWQAIKDDLGRPLLAGAVLLAMGLGLWALADLAAARLGYFRVALFHGYLELCVLALWSVEGTPGAAMVRLPRR